MKKLLIICLLICAGCGSHIRIPDWFPIFQNQELLPLGVFDLQLSKKSGGTKFPLTVVFSIALPTDTKWLMEDVNRKRYIEMPMKLDASRRRVSLEFWDGGRWDLLHTIDGEIFHTGGPSYDPRDIPKKTNI